MSLKNVITLMKETFHEWSDDKAARLAAALSYYTIFSLPPLLLIIIAIAGLAFGKETVQGSLVKQIQGLVGQEGAQIVETMIAGAASQGAGRGILATVFGIAALLLGASGVFGQLQDSLNTVWEVTPQSGRGIWGLIKNRFLSFTMILGIGFLLLVSLVISTGLTAVGQWMENLLPGLTPLVQIFNFTLSITLITLLFALIFKILPDAQIDWDDVWIGALATAFLFTIGKFLLGLYLGRSGVASTYGAAGSLVLILLWIYYSAQILLLGAEFTQVYARHYGSRITSEEETATESSISETTKNQVTPRSPAATLDWRAYPALARYRHPRSQESPYYALSMLGFIAGAILGAIFGTREKKS